MPVQNLLQVYLLPCVAREDAFGKLPAQATRLVVEGLVGASAALALPFAFAVPAHACNGQLTRVRTVVAGEYGGSLVERCLGARRVASRPSRCLRNCQEVAR